MMFKRCFGLLAWLAGWLAPAAAMAAPTLQNEMTIVASQSSPPLNTWQQGQLRIYLQTHSRICAFSEPQPVQGALFLKLHVDAGKNQVKVDGEGVSSPSFAHQSFIHCLERNLKEVAFDRIASKFSWQGTVRFESVPQFLVVLQSWSGKVSDIQLENTILAALEQPAACLDRFFSQEPAISMVLDADLNLTPDGALNQVTVTPRTEGPQEIAACLEQQLASLADPQAQLRRAEMMIYLLRPVQEVPDGVPTQSSLSAPSLKSWEK